MKGFTAKQIADAIGGIMLLGDKEKTFSNISTDTRNVAMGDLFIPLVGIRFDAHDFIEQAVIGGAAGVLIAKNTELNKAYLIDNNISVIKVKDTLKALQSLASYNRQQCNVPVIGVTGSNGKTTTKDMIGAVLETRFKTLKTKGNYNNHIGLPLTLLQLDTSYQAVVVEMGMRGLGEIDELGNIALPDIGVITNIGETHLELLDSVENIAKAKGEILNHLNKKGLAVLNGDDPWVRKISSEFEGRVVFYGFNKENHIRATELAVSEKGSTFKVVISNIDSVLNKYTPETEMTISLPVLGEHNVLNTLAAIAIGIELGIPQGEIVKGLEGLSLTDMRLQLIEHQGMKIINDAYNANPTSVKAAIKTLNELSNGQRSIAVLGNMYELGQREVPGHQEVGEAVFNTNIDYLLTVGDLAAMASRKAIELGMKPDKVFHFDNNKEAVQKLKMIMETGDIILVKGSRGMKMEEIVSAIINAEV